MAQVKLDFEFSRKLSAKNTLDNPSKHPISNILFSVVLSKKLAKQSFISLPKNQGCEYL
jgi:hypothetical protein